MIRTINAQTDNPFDALKGRTTHRDEQTERVVKDIIRDVRMRGDEALLENARKFDAPQLQQLEVTKAEINVAQISEAEGAAIEIAATRVRAFHESQFNMIGSGMEAIALHNARATLAWDMSCNLPSHALFDEIHGPILGQRLLAIERAGVYVPGGMASYPSSVMMNAIPAQAAGVDQVVVTVPARRDGSLHPALLYALGHVGVDRAFKIGGAAAIAALALGTESVPRVDKIVGPGNRFVNEAKRQLWGTVGLDGYAGPSEVCVLADATTNARFAAADLLTQIEHAPDNTGFLVCSDEAKFHEILAEVERQAKGAEREEILRKALAADSIAFLARDIAEACDIVNAIAPEHLSIATQNPERVMERIVNAGCILLGEWSAEAAGDFCAGPSHTLPTSGAARFQSPVNVLDFLKVQSVIRLTRPELLELAPTIETFGKMEGLPIHGRGATIRFEESE